MPANTPRPALAADAGPIVKMLNRLNEGERSFNVYTALLKYGRHSQHVNRIPAHLRRGRVGECFKNCTSAMMPVLSEPKPSYSYAEGYAMDPELALPMEHAWLVDTTGRAIDLSWRESENVLYFGVTIKPAFLLEAMRRTEVYGVLFNPRLQRHLFADEATFAGTLCRPGLPGLPRGKAS